VTSQRAVNIGEPSALTSMWIAECTLGADGYAALPLLSVPQFVVGIESFYPALQALLLMSFSRYPL